VITADSAPAGQVLAFQAADPYIPPGWPDPAHPHQQFQLGFHVEALDQAHSGVLALGGQLLQSAQGWRVYSDLAEPARRPSRSGLSAASVKIVR
jgi:hypothetical protein